MAMSSMILRNASNCSTLHSLSASFPFASSSMTWNRNVAAPHPSPWRLQTRLRLIPQLGKAQEPGGNVDPSPENQLPAKDPLAEPMEPLKESQGDVFPPNLLAEMQMEGGTLVGVLHPAQQPLSDFLDSRIVISPDSGLLVNAKVMPGELLIVSVPSAILGDGVDRDANSPDVFTVNTVSGIWPILHRIARACTPNLAATMAGNAIILRASKTIDSGQILLISPPGVDAASPRQVRATNGAGNCMCEKCILEWRLIAALKKFRFGINAESLEATMTKLRLNQRQMQLIRSAYHETYWVHYLVAATVKAVEGDKAAYDKAAPVVEPQLLVEAMLDHAHGGFVQHWPTLMSFAHLSGTRGYKLLERGFKAWFGDEAGPIMLRQALELTG